MWLTNFLSEIRSLSPHDDETQLHVLSVILGSDLKSETIDDRLQGFQPLQWTWSSLSGLSKKLCEITCPRVKIEKLCQITLQRVMDWQLKNYVKSHVLMYVKTEKLCQITSLLFLHSTLVRKTSVKLNCWVITFRTEKFCQITLLWLYFHIKNRKKLCQITSLLFHHSILNCWVISFRTEKFCQINLLWLYFHIKIWETKANIDMCNNSVWQKNLWNRINWSESKVIWQNFSVDSNCLHIRRTCDFT